MKEGGQRGFDLYERLIGFAIRIITQTASVVWKMGTGSEPPQMPNLWKNAGGSVPVPFFHYSLSG